ncbi:unnamed protein product [Phytophthora fragariaefolia]|uniref:Unnamed protein product n=1 Tax=Phytophthora fragariaefolia TaxID=1490495 RepID=A0A9W6XTW1_9STRA|nr:unnamed protein product [Phytophthora fragariaefolia]
MSLSSATSKTEVYTAWLAAGANGDAATMRELWSQFPEWLGFNQDGKSALHRATSDDVYDVAKLLLDSGANIDARDELLLSRGADIDVKDSDGKSPLTLVLQQSNLNVLQLFLNHHQCVSTPQRHDFVSAVLFEAVEHRNEATIRYIVENEYASVVVQNSAGETLYHRAILRHSSSLMELLNDLDPAGDSLIAVTADAKTPAHYAAQHGSLQEVEMLLRCLTSTFGDLEELEAANPLNTADRRGMTSLFIAAVSLPESWGQKSFHRDAEVMTDRANYEARSAKAGLLLEHGARLFPPSFLVQKLVSTCSNITPEVSGIILPAQVQFCLRSWLVQDGNPVGEPEDEEGTHAFRGGNPHAEALTEVCMRWVTSVVCTGSWIALLPILICEGYAHDVVPLLVVLPLQPSALPPLLSQLCKFARYQLCHPLLIQLHDELQEAYEEIAKPSAFM